jgi:hypothetical protein
MNLLHRAMLHLEEATYHYERASRYLLIYAEEENARLCRTLNSTGQTQEADAPSGTEKRLGDGGATIADVTDRAKVVDIELRRTKARAGIPTELRDIL